MELKQCGEEETPASAGLTSGTLCPVLPHTSLAYVLPLPSPLSPFQALFLFFHYGLSTNRVSRAECMVYLPLAHVSFHPSIHCYAYLSSLALHIQSPSASASLSPPPSISLAYLTLFFLLILLPACSSQVIVWFFIRLFLPHNKYSLNIHFHFPL